MPKAASRAIRTTVISGSRFFFFTYRDWGERTRANRINEYSRRVPKGRKASLAGNTRGPARSWCRARPLLDERSKEGIGVVGEEGCGRGWDVPCVTAPTNLTMLGWFERVSIIWASVRSSLRRRLSAWSSRTPSNIFTATTAPLCTCTSVSHIPHAFHMKGGWNVAVMREHVYLYSPL
jgi:hypothetical protein